MLVKVACSNYPDEATCRAWRRPHHPPAYYTSWAPWAARLSNVEKTQYFGRSIVRDAGELPNGCLWVECRSTSQCPHRPPVVLYHFITVIKMNSPWSKWSPDKGVVAAVSNNHALRVSRLGFRQALATHHNIPAFHGMLHRTAWDFIQIRGSCNTHGSDRKWTQHSILKPDASRSLEKPKHRLKDNIKIILNE